jgi:hypothetical protein
VSNVEDSENGGSARVCCLSALMVGNTVYRIHVIDFQDGRGKR